MGRPLPSFHGFYGQQLIIESLKTHCAGAKRDAVPLPHISLRGPSGSGKTAIARAVAKEMGTTFHEICCSGMTSMVRLVTELQSLNVADILFLDEVHALAHEAQELLYPAFDELKVPKISGKGNSTAGETEDIKPFTLIAASDGFGSLRNALKKRFVLNYTLADYSDEEMRVIVGNCAAEKGILLKPQAVTRLAEACRGLPRRARHLLESLVLCVTDKSVEVTKSGVVRFLDGNGIDNANLTSDDRRYIAFLARRSGHVALSNISTALGLDKAMVVLDIEGYLVKRGLVCIDARGRCLTEAGRLAAIEGGLK